MPSQTRKAGRSRSYKIHDNGGRPFTVDVNEHQRKLSISVSYPDSKTGMSMPPTHFKDYTFKRIWIGDDVFHFGKKTSGWDPKWKGNSILAQLSATRFLEIGKEIFEFTLMPGDAPVSYSSYVGNSDVPYPYLVGKTHTYLMIEDAVIPNDVLDMKRDAYEQYYGFKEEHAHVAASAKKFKKKMIHKRVW